MIGLDRPKLLALAQLLGGDYCEGVAGAGRRRREASESKGVVYLWLCEQAFSGT